jgi:predicted nucleic acid-binding protein
LDLGPGESEAISLALELGVRSILIDERKGFRVAVQRGLQPIGSLAVLEFSAANGWIDFEDYIARLRSSTFRLNERLLTSIRERLDSRKA